MCALFPLPVKKPGEVPLLQASKWMKYPALLSLVEMESLLETLSPCYLAVVSEPVLEENMFIDKEEFLNVYRIYIEDLEKGILPDETKVKKYFSAAITSSLEALYVIQAGSKYLVKAKEPVLQLQKHHFLYSSLDHQIRSMAFSSESVLWGIQFSYPQLFEHPTLHEIIKVDQNCLNGPLFLKLARWMRHFTMPTPFQINGKQVRSPIRIGQKAFEWIKKHPQLQQGPVKIDLLLP